MNIFSAPQMYNTVVGYYREDKVIVKQDDGALFYCEIPSNLIMLGETIAPRDLKSIINLPPEQQEEIKKLYADCEVL